MPYSALLLTLHEHPLVLSLLAVVLMLNAWAVTADSCNLLEIHSSSGSRAALPEEHSVRQVQLPAFAGLLVCLQNSETLYCSLCILEALCTGLVSPNKGMALHTSGVQAVCVVRV